MAFFKQTVKDLPLIRGDHTRVLVRVDYNVPLKDGKVSDDLRIRASLPTLEYLLEHGCSLVLISHLGRPDGERKLEYSLEPVAKYLSKLLKKDVTFVDDIVGDLAYQTVKKSKNGDIIMLQNLRFDPGEEENDAKFAKGIARVARADYFVQDGFAVVTVEHRLKLVRPHVDRVIIMARGRIAEDTTDASILEDRERLEKHYQL